jgi:hypothetical protein
MLCYSCCQQEAAAAEASLLLSRGEVRGDIGADEEASGEASM